MNSKSRYWSFIVYPESAPKEWKSMLSEDGVVFAVSPLHDRDINPDGEKKKAHWHVLIEFEGPTTYNNVKENICDKVNGTIPKKVISLRGYYRYLAHLDNPEKAQYKVEDIECYGGFKMEMTNTEIMTLRLQILEDIIQHDFVELEDLTNWYRETGEVDKMELLWNKTYFIKEYLCSKRNKKIAKEKEENKRLTKKACNDKINVVQ